MFWLPAVLPAVLSALQSNSAQTNEKNMADAQNAYGQQNLIAQKRAQRQQISDSIGNKSTVDIDSIVSGLFPNKKKLTSGGFGNYGFLQ